MRNEGRGKGREIRKEGRDDYLVLGCSTAFHTADPPLFQAPPTSSATGVRSKVAQYVETYILWLDCLFSFSSPFLFVCSL